MVQNYKIFIQKTALFLIDKNDESQAVNTFNESEVEFSLEALKSLCEGKDVVVLKCSEVRETFNSIKALFVPIEAAGGVVENSKGEILWIKRLGMWDLPKGKIEIGEGNKEAAIREVEEETGIQDLNVVEELDSTYHTYNVYGDENFKTTFWYKMNTSFEGKGMPQLEEDITEVKWIRLDDMQECLSNTYGNIKLVIDSYLKTK